MKDGKALTSDFDMFEIVVNLLLNIFKILNILQGSCLCGGSVLTQTMWK